MGGGEVRVDYIEISSFPVRQRITDLIEDVLFHDLVIELLGSTDVYGESLDFVADFASGGGTAVVLGTSRHKFCNVVAVAELVRHVAKEIIEWDVGLMVEQFVF